MLGAEPMTMFEFRPKIHGCEAYFVMGNGLEDAEPFVRLEMMKNGDLEFYDDGGYKVYKWDYGEVCSLPTEAFDEDEVITFTRKEE